ncbi:MAG: UDP-galactopyranose mutase [Brevinemataceae bacterium]
MGKIPQLLGEEMHDILVVGAGFSGSILARKLAEEQNKKVLLVERRPHIAGNMYDDLNEYGILIQEYGPHFLNTNKYWIIEFLQQYKELFKHSTKLLSYIDEKYVRLPFNFQTVQELVGAKKSESILAKLREEFKGEDRVSIYTLMEHIDTEINSYGKLLFDKAFMPYITKMWGLTPDQIDKSILDRVPMALNYDERYLNKDFQYLPKEGFTKLFESMLNHPNITLQLNTNAFERLDLSSNKVTYHGQEFECVIFTGAIDELFDCKYGILPYRSMDFTYETIKGEFVLPCEVVSYPQAKGYTRQTEYKQFNNKFLPYTEYTTVATEWPMQYDKNAEKGNIP